VDRIERRRGEIRAWLDSLTRRHSDIVDASVWTTNDDEHDPEGVTIAFERAQVTGLRQQALDELAALDRAEERVRAGTYGRCARCGADIAEGRLDALPATTTCITCA